MSNASDRSARRGPSLLGAYVGAVIEPVCAKRGFATADLIAAWADIVGPRYAETTQPEKLSWPRRDQANAPTGATLIIRVDAGMAIYLQHETALLLERINGFLGFGAVAKLKIVQGVVAPSRPATPPDRPLSTAANAAIAEGTDSIESAPLREALERLGRAVYRTVERS